MHFGHDKQDRTVTAAMALAARLLPPMARTQRLGLIRMIRACRFLALGAVETLGQVADRRLKRFRFCRQVRFGLYRPRVLRPPVVRFPLELDIVLLRQHHRLLGKRRRALIIDRCKLSGGDALWLSAFHGLGYSSFFWKVPFFLMATMGCPNIYGAWWSTCANRDALWECCGACGYECRGNAAYPCAAHRTSTPPLGTA